MKYSLLNKSVALQKAQDPMIDFFNDFISQLYSYNSSLVVFLPKLLMALLFLLVMLFFANRSRNFIERKLELVMDDPLLARFIARLVKLTWMLVTFMICLNIVGLTGIATGLVTGASVSAIVVGFAFKDIGENFLSGIMLAFNRPFRVGDVVELDGYKGQVITLNLRNTQIKTFDGKDIYIPNASIVKNPVINYTIDGYQRYDLAIGINSHADIPNVIDLITAELKSISGILQGTKEPSVAVSGIASGTVNLTAYYWMNTFNKEVSSTKVKNEAVQKILTAMAKAKVSLPGNVIELRSFNSSVIQEQFSGQ